MYIERAAILLERLDSGLELLGRVGSLPQVVYGVTVVAQKSGRILNGVLWNIQIGVATFA